MSTYPGVILGVPYQPPPPPRNLWTGARMYMIDRKGTRWAFTGRKGTGVRMQSGVRGLGLPSYEQFKTPYSTLPGSQFRGVRAKDREVYWPLWVWNDTSDQDWLDYDSSFWDALPPGEVVTWEVEQPNGTSRYLDVRVVDDGNVAFNRAPGMHRWVPYGINLEATDPYWRGPRLFESWGAGFVPVPFFGGVGSPGGPPFYITSDAITANASIYNPGDVPEWAEIEVEGPVTDFQITINGFSIGYAPDIPVGSTLVVRTDPQRQGAYLNGVRVTTQLSPRQFAPLAPKVSTELNLQVTGTGSVTVSFTPKYRRAW